MYYCTLICKTGHDFCCHQWRRAKHFPGIAIELRHRLPLFFLSPNAFLELKIMLRLTQTRHFSCTNVISQVRFRTAHLCTSAYKKSPAKGGGGLSCAGACSVVAHADACRLASIHTAHVQLCRSSNVMWHDDVPCDDCTLQCLTATRWYFTPRFIINRGSDWATILLDQLANNKYSFSTV